MRFLIRLLVGALGLWAATQVVDGITLTGSDTTSKTLTLLAVALVFGVVNAVVRPVVKVLSLPFYLLTLGLFFLVVNALMLWLTGAISDALDLSFGVSGFGAAFLGGIVVSLVSFAANVVLPERYETK